MRKARAPRGPAKLHAAAIRTAKKGLRKRLRKK
jgi:hypothetical protein